MKIYLVSSNFQASNCLVYEGGTERGLDEVLRIEGRAYEKGFEFLMRGTNIYLRILNLKEERGLPQKKCSRISSSSKLNSGTVKSLPNPPKSLFRASPSSNMLAV